MAVIRPPYTTSLFTVRSSVATNLVFVAHSAHRLTSLCVCVCVYRTHNLSSTHEYRASSVSLRNCESFNMAFTSWWWVDWTVASQAASAHIIERILFFSYTVFFFHNQVKIAVHTTQTQLHLQRPCRANEQPYWISYYKGKIFNFVKIILRFPFWFCNSLYFSVSFHRINFFKVNFPSAKVWKK